MVILCQGGYNNRWSIKKVTTDLSNRRDKLIVAIHAQLLVKGVDPAEPELFFLLPLQNKVKKNKNYAFCECKCALSDPICCFWPSCISSTPVVWVV